MVTTYLGTLGLAVLVLFVALALLVLIQLRNAAIAWLCNRLLALFRRLKHWVVER